MTVTNSPPTGICAPPDSSHILRGHSATCHGLPPTLGHRGRHVHHQGLLRERLFATCLLFSRARFITTGGASTAGVREIGAGLPAPT